MPSAVVALVAPTVVSRVAVLSPLEQWWVVMGTDDDGVRPTGLLANENRCIPARPVASAIVLHHYHCLLRAVRSDKDKAVKLTPSRALLALFGELLRTHKASHGLPTDLHLPGDLVNAVPKRVQFAHPEVALITAATTFHLYTLVSSTRHLIRLFAYGCGDDFLVSRL